MTVSLEKPTFCHRVYGFLQFALQNEITKVIAPQLEIRTMPCKKAECTLWSKEKLKCFDVIQAEALALLASLSVAKSQETEIKL